MTNVDHGLHEITGRGQPLGRVLPRHGDIVRDGRPHLTNGRGLQVVGWLHLSWSSTFQTSEIS
jgi:hypothetical protein